MVANQLMDALSDRLSLDMQLFDHLLKLIPAKFYMMDKSEDGQGKFQHNKRKKAPKQLIKDATKKAKRSKLDPTQPQSALEQQKITTIQKDDSIPIIQLSGLVDESLKSEMVNNVQPMEKSDITQLRHRLQDRIDELRKKRNAPNTGGSSPRSREDILAARNKKKEDRKKAIKNQKEKGGKATQEELVQFDDKKSLDKSRPSADSIKMDGKVFFGKISVGQEEKKKGPSDAKTQLKMLEAKKEKIEKLKEEDKVKADALREKEEWNRVIALATGDKPKDDTKLLKKTIKRQEKEKVKSAQEWNKRIDKVKYDEKKKIKKREENIKNKVEAKLNKKKGIKPKPATKTKARPGFEGGRNSKGGKVTKPSPPKGKGKK